MGSQVPDVPIRFAASFGRRLLHDPGWLSVGLICRFVWFEANLIATEYDGVFHELAIDNRLRDAAEMDGDYTRGDPANISPVDLDRVLERLTEAGLVAPVEDDPGWWRIRGWSRWQADPLAPPARKAKTSTERSRETRERKRAAPAAGAAPAALQQRSAAPAASRAGASVSSSSSESKTPARKRTRETGGKSLKELLGPFEEVIKGNGSVTS